MIEKKEKMIAANFKMNLNLKFELDSWLKNFVLTKKGMRVEKTKLVLCPNFTQISLFAGKIKANWVRIGAQNCSWETKGRFTGEVSPVAISSAGGEYVILGHSERREHFQETNLQIAQKAENALKNNLNVILCVGEMKRGDGAVETKKQLKEIFGGISRTRAEKIVVCYEPVWAISGNNPGVLLNSNEIMEAKLIIKKFLVESFGRGMAERMKIIYGGSVSPLNFKEFCLDSGMDGALVGNASLSPVELLKMVKVVESS